MNLNNETIILSIPLTLPTGFYKMPPEEMDRQYPNKAQMPQEAFYSEDGTAILGINHRADKFDIKDIQQFKEKVFDQSVKRAHPEYTSEIQAINGVPCVLMSYKVELEEPLYMSTLFSCYQKRMLFIAFTCPYQDKEKWRPVLDKTFQTLQLKI